MTANDSSSVEWSPERVAATAGRVCDPEQVQALLDAGQGGDAEAVRDILHHNLLDLLTMAQIVGVLLTGAEPEGLMERGAKD